MLAVSLVDANYLLRRLAAVAAVVVVAAAEVVVAAAAEVSLAGYSSFANW